MSFQWLKLNPAQLGSGPAQPRAGEAVEDELPCPAGYRVERGGEHYWGCGPGGWRSERVSGFARARMLCFADQRRRLGRGIV